MHDRFDDLRYRDLLGQSVYGIQPPATMETHAWEALEKLRGAIRRGPAAYWHNKAGGACPFPTTIRCLASQYLHHHIDANAFSSTAYLEDARRHYVAWLILKVEECLLDIIADALTGKDPRRLRRWRPVLEQLGAWVE
jgi:hypothetical protein